MITQHQFNILKYLVFISVIILGLWLINLNFPINGQRHLSLNFFQDQPMTSKLGPGDRLKQKDDLALIIDHPVYFDLRVLPWFNQARITLIYQSNGRLLEGLGYQTGPGFSFSVIKPISVKEIDQNFSEALFIFDLNKVFTLRNVTRFLIASQIDSENIENELIIKSLKINLLR